MIVRASSTFLIASPAAQNLALLEVAIYIFQLFALLFLSWQSQLQKGPCVDEAKYTTCMVLSPQSRHKLLFCGISCGVSCMHGNIGGRASHYDDRSLVCMRETVSENMAFHATTPSLSNNNVKGYCVYPDARLQLRPKVSIIIYRLHACIFLLATQNVKWGWDLRAARCELRESQVQGITFLLERVTVCRGTSYYISISVALNLFLTLSSYVGLKKIGLLCVWYVSCYSILRRLWLTWKLLFYWLGVNISVRRATATYAYYVPSGKVYFSPIHAWVLQNMTTLVFVSCEISRASYDTNDASSVG